MALKHAADILKNRGYFSDFQRPNFFEVVMSGFNQSGPAMAKNEKVKLTADMIQGITYPMTLINPIEIKRMGKRLQMPGEATNSQEIQLTLNADVEGEIRRFFSEWQKNFYVKMDSPAFSPEHKFTTSVSVDIYTLDGNHNRRSSTKLFNVWPKMIGEMSFSHTTDNEISTFPVTLAFSYSEYRN